MQGLTVLWAILVATILACAYAFASPPDSLREQVSAGGSWLPYVNAVPSSDGLGMYLSVGQPTQEITPVLGLLNVPVGGPCTGPTGYLEDHTLQYAGNQEGLATYASFYPNAFSSPSGTPCGSVTISTTAVISGPTLFGPLSFRRYPISVTQATDLSSVDGLLMLHLDGNSLPSDAFAVILPTNAPPGPLPSQAVQAGSMYNVRASGAVITTTQPGILWYYYTPETLRGLDPDTLHIFRWEGASLRWVDLGGILFPDQQAVVTSVDRFGVYALLAKRLLYLPMIGK